MKNVNDVPKYTFVVFRCWFFRPKQLKGTHYYLPALFQFFTMKIENFK